MEGGGSVLNKELDLSVLSDSLRSRLAPGSSGFMLNLNENDVT